MSERERLTASLIVTRKLLHYCRSLRSARYIGLMRCGEALALLGLLTIASSTAHAFPHVVQPGETLAQISERVYGHIEMEKVLVAANGLDAGNGFSISPGMRLEIPAQAHYRVSSGDTWQSLAQALLGDPERADVLSISNDSSPWMPLVEGTELRIPYNLRVIVGPTDSLVSIAQRFMGSKEKAWTLDRYNHLKSEPPKRGQIILVPVVNLKLSERGREEAIAATAFERSEAAGASREVQRRVDSEMPGLLNDVRSGRYVDAVAKGSKMLSSGELSKAQQSLIHRQMLEAYVALDAYGLAATSCRAWRESDPSVDLDGVYLSPKIIDACEIGARGR